MTHFIAFAGVDINPATIWKITRVTDTVTIHTLTEGMGNTPYSEDFVFGSEALAITALSDFLKETEKGQMTLAAAMEAVISGELANHEITKGALNNISLGDIDARTDALIDAMILIALKIKIKYDAVVI